MTLQGQATGSPFRVRLRAPPPGSGCELPLQGQAPGVGQAAAVIPSQGSVWHRPVSCTTLWLMALHHINFHTVRNIPVFEQPVYDAMMRACLGTLIDRHGILCPAREVMPTHVHLIIEDFPDFPRGEIVNRLKGGAAFAFFRAHPELRADLLGGHLWSKGYYAVLITSQTQLTTTIAYIRNNRANASLPPPSPLEHIT